MKKLLTEQKVLKKLNIQDFRYLTKDKVIAMVSMLDKMEPDVAKKALEQFPDFANTMKTVLNDYKEELDVTLNENGESVKAYYTSCDVIISSLQKQLEKEDLSFDERKYIINKMMEVNQMKCLKDTENKKFLAALTVVSSTTVIVVAGILFAALGGNTQIGMDEYNDI